MEKIAIISDVHANITALNAVLEDITKLNPAPKVVVTTALSSSNFVHRAMQLGASYFMVKPLIELDLDRVIM